MSYYHQRIFQCEVSGKSNLTYFEAAASEAQHTLAIQSQFPDALKVPILAAVQFQITGRLNDLVERLFDLVKARFFPGEKVVAELDSGKTLCVVRDVTCGDTPHAPSALSLNDDPAASASFVYTVEEVATKGVTHTLAASALSRERHALSKSILRRYLRDSVYRDSHVGSIWYVRENLVRRFHLPTAPTAEQAAQNEHIKDAKLSKRRKLVETEASAAKRAAKQQRLKEKEDKAAALAKQKVLKFPCEDLLLDTITAAELQTSMPGELARRTARPAPGGEEMLAVPADVFEPFLAVYYFLLTLSEPLGLSSIALDDLEGALRHPVCDPPCALLCEVHGTLLSAIVRDGTHCREWAPATVAQKRKTEPAAHDTPDVSMTAAEEDTKEATAMDDSASELSDLSDSPEREVMDAAREMGRGWARKEMQDEVRSGWERQLVGCLAECATPEALPRMYEILAYLTGVYYDDDALLEGPSSSQFRTVAERYPHLPLLDKVHILLFLCELAVMTRSIKAYYEECEAHLTELRKERMELARTRRQMLEQQKEQAATTDVKEETQDVVAEASSPAAASDSDSERDELASDEDELDDDEEEADASMERYKRIAGSRQEALREKAQQREEEAARLAAEYARAKEQNRETKQLREERRRWEETLHRMAKREEAIEREFRRYGQIPRLRPLGRDRFLDRYYWLDGIGAATPSTSHGGSAYQTARLFVQAPTRREWDALSASYADGTEALLHRKRAEHSAPADSTYGSWAVYTQPEQVEELIAWLRPKGVREHALKAQLLKHRDAMESAMRRRTDDIALGVREPAVETRRSARVRSEQATQWRLPYMQWRNAAK